MSAPNGNELVFRFGEFELFPFERTLLRNGARVALTPRMFDLLLALVEAEGHLLSKETLLNTVWADAAVEEGNLNRTISALRKALDDKTGEPRYIETIPKAGYRFIAPVETGSRTAVVDAKSSTVRADEIDLSEPSRRSRFGIVAGGVLLLVVVGVLSVAYLVYSRGQNSKPMQTENPSKFTRLTNNAFDEDSAAWTDDGRIRFLRFSSVNKVDSMVMSADGSNQQIAGKEIRNFRAGTWSPDGRRVIYSKDGEAPRASFVANADGSDELRLPFNIGPFDWSSDSKRIVYSASFPTDADNGEVVLYSFETGQLTNLTNSPAFDANPSFSPDGQHVIFNSDRDGNAEIYVMNVDGTGIRRLTNHPAKEAFHAFSPDGTQIVFNSNRENEKVGLYLMSVNDDSPPVRLSDAKHNAEIRPGCWSRDGTKIVFMSDMEGDKFNIYSMDVEPAPARQVGDASATGEIRGAALSPDGGQFALAVKLADGSGELRLMDATSGATTTITSTENHDLAQSWSPDGKSIVFAMKKEGNTEIFTVNRDGSDLKNLTNNSARDGSPAWSPDGTRVIFSSDREAQSEGVNLFLMNIDGSDVRRFSSRRGYEMTPAWSPDGKTIAYACDRTDGSSQVLDITIADPNDPNTERIVTRRRFHDSNPSFSPDGRRLAFASQSDGNFEIYLVNTDGSGLVRVTRNPGEDTMPVFSRDGTKIFFVSNRSGRFGLYEIGVTQ